VTIDRTLRECARATIPTMVKRILSTSGSPSDLQKEAVKTILVQASMFFAEWVELPQASRNPSIPCQAR